MLTSNYTHLIKYNNQVANVSRVRYRHEKQVKKLPNPEGTQFKMKRTSESIRRHIWSRESTSHQQHIAMNIKTRADKIANIGCS